jgi:hypothetical protein
LRAGMTLREFLAVVVSTGHFPGRTLDEIYAERSSLCTADKAAESFVERRGDRFVLIPSHSLAGGGCLFTLEDITERRQPRRGSAAEPGQSHSRYKVSAHWNLGLGYRRQQVGVGCQNVRAIRHPRATGEIKPRSARPG